MTRIFALAACLIAVMPGLARAGDAGAGPVGSGSSGVGSVITPGSNAIQGTVFTDMNGFFVPPGDGGSVQLGTEQIAGTAAALRSFPGATEEGTRIRAPAALQDGTQGFVMLDTATGALMIVRR